MENGRFANTGGVSFVPVPGSSAFDVVMSSSIIHCGRLATMMLGGFQVLA